MNLVHFHLNPLGVGHLIFYMVVLGLYITTASYDSYLFWGGKYKKAGFPFDHSYGGRAKFLTYNNLVLQIIFFLFSAISTVLNIIVRNRNISDASIVTKVYHNMRVISNFLYATLAFPVGMAVSINFWAIFFIDRKLIFPEILDTIIPAWENHGLHTLPFVSLLIEAYITKHKYTSFFKGALCTVAFILTYIGWTFYIAFDSDQWVYGVLQELSPLLRGLFIFANALFSVALYKVGDLLNSCFWSKHMRLIGTTYEMEDM